MTNLQEVTNQVLSDIREARELIENLEGLPVLEQIDLLIARAELGVQELRQISDELDELATPKALSSEQFGVILNAIRARWPDKERLELINDMGMDGSFTSAQVRALLETFDFDADRKEAAVRLYPQVTDKALFFQVLETFDHPIIRDEVRQRLNLA